MKPYEVRAHIEQGARRFNAELHTGSYAETHSDASQLSRLSSFLSPSEGEVLLDLGTGSGYVAMALAREHAACFVVGLDIAEEAIAQNVAIAEQQGVSNADFRAFDGVTLPFGEDHFDAALCRYAFHHLPRPEATLQELTRTIRSNGTFVLADPIRDEDDETDFINDFQRLKRDGHMRIHPFRELVDLLSCNGFELADSFESSLSFCRSRSGEYDALIASTPPQVRNAYTLTVDEEEIRLTFRIMNAAFLNRKSPS